MFFTSPDIPYMSFEYTIRLLLFLPSFSIVLNTPFYYSFFISSLLMVSIDLDNPLFLKIYFFSLNFLLRAWDLGPST